MESQHCRKGGSALNPSIVSCLDDVAAALLIDKLSVDMMKGVPRIRAMTLYTYGDPTVFGRLNTFRHA